MVKLESVKRGIASYLDSELIPQINNPLGKFGAGVVISLSLTNLGNVAKNSVHNPIVSMIGVTDGESVDIEALAAAAKANMPKEGLKLSLPAIGDFTFHEADVEELVNLITMAEKGEQA